MDVIVVNIKTVLQWLHEAPLRLGPSCYCIVSLVHHQGAAH